MISTIMNAYPFYHQIIISFDLMEESKTEDKTQAFVLQKIEEYLRSHPSSSSIEYMKSVFKLTHTYSTPFTDSKNFKETFLVH